MNIINRRTSGRCIFYTVRVVSYIYIYIYSGRKLGFSSSKFKDILRPTVSRPAYPVMRPPSGIRYQFLLSLSWIILSDFRGFLPVGRPAWRENGSVIYPYNCYWALPALSLLDTSPAELVTIPYCLIWGEIPFLPPLTPSRSTMEVFYTAPSVPGHNWVTLFLRDLNKGIWPSRLNESQMRQYIVTGHSQLRPVSDMQCKT
jgi:hypothetical protein